MSVVPSSSPGPAPGSGFGIGGWRGSSSGRSSFGVLLALLALLALLLFLVIFLFVIVPTEVCDLLLLLGGLDLAARRGCRRILFRLRCLSLVLLLGLVIHLALIFHFLVGPFEGEFGRLLQSFHNTLVAHIFSHLVVDLVEDIVLLDTCFDQFLHGFRLELQDMRRELLLQKAQTATSHENDAVINLIDWRRPRQDHLKGCRLRRLFGHFGTQLGTGSPQACKLASYTSCLRASEGGTA